MSLIVISHFDWSLYVGRITFSFPPEISSTTSRMNLLSILATALSVTILMSNAISAAPAEEESEKMVRFAR